MISLFITNKMAGQTKDEGNSVFREVPKLETKQNTPFFNPQKLHLSLDLGTGVFGSKLGSGSFYSVAPNFSYLVTPKLRIEFGGAFVLSNNNFNTKPVSETSAKEVKQQTNQTIVYASGQYLLSDKITITGSAYKTVNSNNSKQINPYYLDYKGMNLGIDYKLSKNVSIGAQVRVSNSNNPYLNYYNYNGSGMFSPYRSGYVW
jgi:hypothetical protein